MQQSFPKQFAVGAGQPFLAATPGMIEPRRMYSPCSTLLLNPIEIFPLFGRQQVIPVEITFTGQTLTAG